MDTNEIVTLINSVGFPIVACGVIAYLLYKQADNHKTEIEQMTKTLNENTNVISQLKQMLTDILTVYGLYKGDDTE